MPDTLTPITREETYLAAIAGEDVTTPDPICRPEEFLAAIDAHVGVVEQAVTDLGSILPEPEAEDAGKVLTAGDDGTASWQTASKGPVLLTFTGVSTELTTAMTNAFTAAVVANDYVSHSIDPVLIPASSSGVTVEAFNAAVTRALTDGVPLIFSITGLGNIVASSYGSSNTGESCYAQLMTPQYSVMNNTFMFSIVFTTDNINTSILAYVVAQQTKMPIVS